MKKLIHDWKNQEEGAAIIFGLMLGLVGFGLAYAMMLSTIASLNVANTVLMNGRLQQAAETGVNNAVALINAGYNFQSNTIGNPVNGVDRITQQATSTQTSNIRWSWWVTPFDLTNRTDCQNTGTSTNFNCGYYLYSKATMPTLSANATVTVRAVLVPTPIYSATKAASGAITYTARGASLGRHGIYGLSSVSIGDAVNLYSYYSTDSATGTTSPTTVSQNNNKVSIASNGSITVGNVTYTDSRIAAFNTYRIGDFVSGNPSYASCSFKGTTCTASKINKQAYAYSFTAQNTWMTSACTSYNSSFGSTTAIPTGVTCVNSDVTLDKNTVAGTAANPSILIINGNLNFTSGAQINLNKAPEFLQIYITGNVTFSANASSSSNISAIIVASGSGKGIITMDPGVASSSIKFYGVVVGNQVTINGNVDFWQDLNTKYLKNTGDKVAYQFYNLQITDSVRDNIPISIIGQIYGGGFAVDSSPQNLVVR